MDTQQAIVIGGGPAGLASAAELQRAGIGVTVLEQSDGVGSSWRNRYDRLRLNSSRPFAKLPGSRYAKGTPMFPSRDEFVRYLEDYAADNGLDVRLRTRVERLDRDGAGWLVRTSNGDLRADQVIVAAGYQKDQFIPAWPGRDRYEGRLLHSGRLPQRRSLPGRRRPGGGVGLLGHGDRPRPGDRRRGTGAAVRAHPAEHPRPQPRRPAVRPAADEARAA